MEKDYLKVAKDIAGSDKKDILLHTTKASVHGAVTGLIIGLMVGHWKDKNIYVSGLLGAVLGGVATNIIVRK